MISSTPAISPFVTVGTNVRAPGRLAASTSCLYLLLVSRLPTEVRLLKSRNVELTPQYSGRVAACIQVGRRRES